MGVDFDSIFYSLSEELNIMLNKEREGVFLNLNSKSRAGCDKECCCRNYVKYAADNIRINAVGPSMQPNTSDE
jgi:hypothetical protein